MIDITSRKHANALRRQAHNLRRQAREKLGLANKARNHGLTWNADSAARQLNEAAALSERAHRLAKGGQR